MLERAVERVFFVWFPFYAIVWLLQVMFFKGFL